MNPKGARVFDMKIVMWPASVVVLLAGCGSGSGDTVTGPSSLVTPTCGPASVVQLATNQATTLACSSGTFINLAGGAKYLIVPQFASGGINSGIADTRVSYQIGVSTSATASIASASSLAPAPQSAIPFGSQRQLDFILRERARRAVRAGAWSLISRGTTRAPDFATAASAAAVPDSGSLRTFHVLKGVTLQSETFGTATARLSYVGANLLLYVDTLAPANGFTPSQLQAFGRYFDQVLYSLALANFGPPSDLDANNRVIMLISPAVNGLSPSAQCATQGFVAGYFDGTDFTTSTNSNRGEIFYSVIPDPSGTASCAHTVADIGLTIPATFLHELQHLINFSQHVAVRGSQAEEGWLDEGLSIRAEELGSEYFEAKYPPPSGRTSPAQLFPDSAQGFVQGFLFDSYDYLLHPDTASVTLHEDDENGFSWRGSDWLLVHWLGDLKTKAVFAKLEQSALTGIPNIAAAAGEPFAALFGDFSLAMWTDSLPGIPRSSIPPRDRLQTRNLRQLYQRVFDTNQGSATFPRPYPVLPVTLTTTAAVTASMVPGTMAFYILDLTGSPGNVAIRFSGPAGAALSTTLNPQVSVYRLP